MSSFKMHIAISEIIKKDFSFSDEFLLGTILPDLYKIILNDREKTHFEQKIGEEYLPNLDKFCKQYGNNKSELTYGYLAHLIEDKVWFHQYINQKYIKKLEKGKYYKYKKDNSIHTAEECDNDIYTDYSIIDEYIIKKHQINIENIKESLKKIVNTKKELTQREKIIQLIDEKIINYANKYDTSKGITLFTKEDADEYFEIAKKETEKKLKEFINNKIK